MVRLPVGLFRSLEATSLCLDFQKVQALFVTVQVSQVFDSGFLLFAPA